MARIRKRSQSPQDLVSRAARTAGSTTGPDRGTKHFIALVVAVILAGSTMVGFAWAQRQYDYPTLFDSWQNAYGVYDCQTDQWLEPFDSLNNPNGIRSRNDGVVYIEPNDEAVTGAGAVLEVFLDNVGVELSDEELILADGTTLSEAGATCNGEPAQLSVIRWDPAISTEVPVEIRTEELGAMRFLGDQQAFAIALTPADTEVALPPSVDQLVGAPADDSGS